MELNAVHPQPNSSNAIRVIQPYWHAGTWVFDDPEVGLVREPFVSGVPEILSDLVSGILNADKGFRLTFSEQPFPGYEAEFNRLRSEYGGTWYRASDGREGWLCPALFKYFAHAPEKLFVRVDTI